MKKTKTRIDLVNEKSLLQEQLNALNDKIAEADYSQKFSKMKKFVGKCYNISPEQHKGLIRSVFFYDINKKTCELQGLSVYDFSGGQGTHFGVEYTHLYNTPKEDTMQKYTEISKKEFMKNYNNVMKQIEEKGLKNTKL